MKCYGNVGGYACVFDKDGHIWISDMKYNGLVKCDLKKEKIEYIKKFEGYDIRTANLHGVARRVKNRLFFFPLAANHVHIYDIESEKETSIEIPKERSVKYFAREIYTENNGFLIFPKGLDGTIWRIDAVKETVSRQEKLTDFFNQYTIEERRNSTFCFDERKMFISLPARKEIVVLDLVTFDKRVILFELEYVICHMVKNNDELWVTVSDTFDIYHINIESGEIEKYVALGRAQSNKERVAPYSDIVFVDKHVFASNYYAKDILCANESGVVQNFTDCFLNGKRINERQGDGPIFAGIIPRGEMLYFIPGRASKLIEYNYRSGNCRCIALVIMNFKDVEMEKEFICAELSYQMEGVLSLKDYIEICLS